jgi:hypothetical protein
MVQYKQEDVADFFSNAVWKRVTEILKERQESAITMLRDPGRDPERDQYRATASEIDFILRIKEVLLEELKQEETNG